MPWSSFPGRSQQYTDWYYRTYPWYKRLVQDPASPSYLKRYKSEMAFKRKFRSSHGVRKRRRFNRPRAIKRMGRNTKFYRKKAFAGSRKWTPKKLARCIESKVLEIIYTNNITLTNGLVSTTREYAICPTQNLVQGGGAGQFSGTCCWIKGISIDFFIGVAAATTDAFHWTLDAFRTVDVVDYSASAWTQLAAHTNETSQRLNFYDRSYQAAGPTDAVAFMAPPNRRGGGPTCIYRKRGRFTPSGGSGAQSLQRVKVWLPLNQQFIFRNEIGDDTSLDTAPNFAKHGDVLFIFKFYNSTANIGVQQGIILSGTKARVYFKDP